MNGKIHILPGDPPIAVAMKKNGRAKRFTLRVSRASGTVSLSMPQFAPEAEALDFLRARSDWVRHQLKAAPEMCRPEIGGTIPIQGVMRAVIAGQGRSARFRDGCVEIPDTGRAGPLMATLLKQMARDALTQRSDFYATKLGRDFGRITLRDTKSRWGSCSSKGDLMFSWRLIMAPAEVLDYVAAHEVAHLAEMNHSRAFWKICEQMCPDYHLHRDWLRRQGATLQAWRFDRLP